MRLKKAYECGLCSEGSLLLAKGSADLNTNREMRAWLRRSSGLTPLKKTIRALFKINWAAPEAEQIKNCYLSILL